MKRFTTMALAAFALLHCLTVSAAEPVKNIVLVHGVHIPRQTGHPFHAKLDTDSAANWTPVPAQTGH